MATVKIEVSKTYMVELEVPRSELDITGLLKKAKRMVDFADSRVVYQGTESIGVTELEYTAEELAESEREEAERLAFEEVVERHQESLGADRNGMAISLSDEQKRLFVEGAYLMENDGPYRFFYSGGFGLAYTSPIYHSPMIGWEDLIIEADEAIGASGDSHHIFLEGVQDMGTLHVFEGDEVVKVRQIGMLFGS